MRHIRQISLLTAILILAGAVASCDNSETGGAQTTDDTGTTANETTTSPLDPGIEAVDCGGREYTLLARVNGDSFCFPYAEFFAEEETGDPLNDAVYKRNNYIEEKYNLKLNIETVENVSLAAAASIMAGDNEYDIIFPSHQEAFEMMKKGQLLEVSDLPHVDISKPYWMRGVMDSTSVMGSRFFLTGDLNLQSLNSIGVIYFNKKLAEDNGVGDLYGMVRSGEWTLDKFSECCRGVTADLDGDGLDADDRYGLTTNGFAWQPFLAGCGTTLIGKDKDGSFTFDWDSEKNVGIITHVISLLNDHESVMLVNQNAELQSKYGGIGEASIAMFREDRALFWIEMIYASAQQRDMNSDFGFLPMPKYDDRQESYMSYMHMGWSTTSAVPVTNDDHDLTGRLLEDMAWKSSETVRPAYYDRTLQGKISRDDDSGEMLDIIYSGLNIDPSIIMAASLPIDAKMRGFLIDGKDSFISEIAANKEKCVGLIEKINTTVEEVLQTQGKLAGSPRVR